LAWAGGGRRNGAGDGVGAEARTAKPAEAVLTAASSGEVRKIVDGRLWRCLGTGCRGRAVSAPKSQPLLAECRAVAAALGPLSLYRSGRALDEAELAACNTAAPTTSAANP
jgi:hypothetical protein